MNLELFPCSGGMAEGFRRAGVRFDMSFDIDPNACDSYEKNLGHRPIQMDVRDLLRMLRAGWEPCRVYRQHGPWKADPVRVDLIVADPPCTPWSRAGKREGLEDERDMLAETVELLDLLRPRCWLIANVPGLDDADHWRTVVQPVFGGFARRGGYCVDYASFDAADYGVPQRRIRPFWFAHPTGTPCIAWPAPTHCAPPVLTGCGLKPWVTCREALGHLPADELGRQRALRYRAARATTEAQRRRAWKKPRASRIEEPAETIRAKADAMMTWPWDRPSLTVTSDPNGRLPPPGRHESGSYLSQPGGVVLSEKAAAILQGFCASWVFSGATKAARWDQIGMAMPPGLAEPVARSIVRWFERAGVALGAS